MAVIFTRERVRDYGAFRQVFETGTQMRRSNGVLEESVYRDEDDANTVAILLRFASLAEAHAFSGSAALREVMAQAGIEEGSRRVEFYDEP
jgi:heme-degrading monooxygenase HmoA